MVHEGNPEENDPVLVIQGVPNDGDLTYSSGGENGIKLEVKQKPDGFNPFGKIWDLIKSIGGRVFDTAQIAVGVGNSS